MELAAAGFAAAGIRIERVLTDNGASYRSRALAAVLERLGARHRWTRPYRPQTIGKAERFIRTLLAACKVPCKVARRGDVHSPHTLRRNTVYLFLNRSRRTALSVALAVGLAALPAVATAAVSPTYAVSGLELPSTPTQATFVGVASGSDHDRALWKAVVDHNVAAITDGTFSMTTNDGTKVTGEFSGGSITPTPPTGSGCSRTETFLVDGDLSNVNGGTYVNGTGNFVATLTHYRILWRGRCITYAATVKGTVTFEA